MIATDVPAGTNSGARNENMPGAAYAPVGEVRAVGAKELVVVSVVWEDGVCGVVSAGEIRAERSGTAAGARACICLTTTQYKTTLREKKLKLK